MNRIDIARDFSKYPAGRFRADGVASGEQFRDDLLMPALDAGSVEIVFDGVAGLPSSFLEEALGGLVRKGKRLDFLRQHLRIKALTPRMRSYEMQAWRYITEAEHRASTSEVEK